MRAGAGVLGSWAAVSRGGQMIPDSELTRSASLAMLGTVHFPYLAEAARRQEEALYYTYQADQLARGLPSLETLLAELRRRWPDAPQRVYMQLCTGYLPEEEP